MCGCGRTSTVRGIPGAKIDRAHVIEEHERSDHAAPRGRQHASDLEAAEVAAPLLDDVLDHRAMITAAGGTPRLMQRARASGPTPETATGARSAAATTWNCAVGQPLEDRDAPHGAQHRERHETQIVRDAHPDRRLEAQAKDGTICIARI